MVKRTKMLIFIILALTFLISGTLITPKLSLANTTESNITITGTIALPAGEAAPAGGLKGKVYLYPQNGENSISTAFTIPARDNSVTYTATVPVDALNTKYCVRYYLDNTYPGYVRSGYYVTGGKTSTDYESAIYFNTSAGGINLMIYKGNTVSGTLSLPAGKTAPVGGIEGYVAISPQDGPGSYSADFKIPENGSAANYTVTVPIDAQMTGYRVSYGFNSSYTYPGFVGNGYYSLSGTTADYSAATLINVGSTNIDGINLTIYTGKTITGTISLPEGRTAPTGGINGYVSVSALTGGDYYDVNINIPETDSSATYTVTVPESNGATLGYNVEYYISDSESCGYVKRGYYSSGGTTSTNDDEAIPVYISNENISNIDFAMIAGNVISGTVSLPSGMTAPIGGLEGDVSVTPDDKENGYYARFNIPAEKSTVNYAIVVPIDTSIPGYRVGYGCYDSNDASYPGYIRNGYYSNGETTTNYSSSTLVDINAGNVDGVDLTLIKGATISGTISLPEDQTAPVGGMEVDVSISDFADDEGFWNNDRFEINYGESTVEYISTVPINDTAIGYRVGYKLHSDSEGILKSGFYTTGGTTSDYGSATPVLVGTSNVNDINLTLLKGTVVSGTVSLPGNNTAPVGGLEGSISIYPKYGGNGGAYTSFEILAGQHTAKYTATLPTNTSDIDYVVNYYLYSNSNTNGYLSSGYYATGGTTHDYSLLTPVTVGATDVTDIDLTILKGTILSGTVSLPGDNKAPTGGLGGSISIYPRNGGSGGTSAEFEILAGESSTTYTATLPANSTSTDYYLTYYLYSNSNTNGYLTSGHYAAGGTTQYYSSATPVAVGATDVTGINLTILKGTMISGTVSLPGDNKAPAGGLEGYISIDPKNGGSGGSSAYFEIAAGEGSTTYTATFAPNSSSTDYLVSYYLYSSSSSGYLNNGYYATGGTTQGYSSATPVAIGATDVTGINLTLIKGTILSGTISLPGDNKAPTGGLEGYISISPKNGGGGSSTYFEIAAGEGSTTYTATFPPNSSGSDYLVSYSLSDSNSSGYLNDGYYATGGTTLNSDLATPVTVGAADVTGVNLTLIKGTIVTGIISLPEGKTAPIGGLEGNIDIYSESSGSGSCVSFEIAEGQRTATYTATLPVNTDYRVSYNLYNSPLGLFNHGYYATSGTTQFYSSATPVAVGVTDVTGINLTILKNTIVTGTISLPGDNKAPTGGIEGNISIYPENGGSGGTGTNFEIAAGEGSTTYSAILPPNSSSIDYLINYYLYSSSSSGYLNYGYYAIGGTTQDYSSATPVAVGATDVTGINLTLLKGTILSGTISLPGNNTAPTGGLEGYISIYPENGGSGGTSANFRILPGENSTTYTAIALPNTDYLISYNLFGSAAGYYSSGYYAIGGTTLDYNEASHVLVNTNDVTGIDLNLLKATVISGSISLPGNTTAPAGGIEGYVILETQNTSPGNSAWFYIPAESSSGSFSLNVPLDASSTAYLVRYSLYYVYSGYQGSGYYSTNGTTSDSNSATPVDVTMGDVTELDIPLLLTSPDPLDDHGNTISEATAINLGTTITGQINPASDIDYFKFTPDHTGSYSFTTISDADTYGQLYDAQGFLLTYNDDANGDTDFLITQQLEDGQNYYLKVNLYSSYNTGNYQLSVTEITDPTVPVLGVYLDKSVISLTVGQTDQLTAYVMPINASDTSVTWTVSSTTDSAIVSISDTGLVTALNAGTAVIRVTSNADATKYAEANVTVVSPRTISGTIALPEGVIAPVGVMGIAGDVYADPQNGGSIINTSFYIPPGSNFANYSILVPEDAYTTSYKIRYSLNYSGYTNWGYYAVGGTTTNHSSATLVNVSGGSESDINLELLKIPSISGTISLPGDMVAPDGGITGSIFIRDGGTSYTTDFNIPAGSSSGSYIREIPPLAAGSNGYYISYVLYNNYTGYLEEGYYATAGTTLDSNSATLIPASSGNIAGVNLTLLRGTVISGTINLPDGVPTSDMGLSGYVTIEQQNSSQRYSVYFNIPSGERSVNYSKTLPPNTSTKYRVGYYLYNSNDYLEEGYYSSNGTTNLNTATWISPDQGNVTGINLTLLTGRTISGTISLPDNHTAPSTGLWGDIEISPEGGGNTYYGDFYIPEGDSSSSYLVRVPEDTSITGYRVNYWLASYISGNYVRTGYYSATGTTSLKDSTLVSVTTGNAININLTPLVGNTITGKVSLPNGELASEGIWGSVYVSLPQESNSSYENSTGTGAGGFQENDNVKYSANFYISQGQNSATYTTEAIPIDSTISGYHVFYSLQNNTPYVNEGYYSLAGTTTSKSATLVNPNAGSVSNINLTLLTGHEISGTISLPDNSTTGSSIHGIICVDPLNGGNSYSKYFYIPYGANSANYSVIVPSDPSISGYRVNYSLYQGNGYVGEGYYSSSGTTSAKSATLVGANADVSNINLTLRTGNTISGTISLPDGMTASTGIELLVRMDPLDGGNPYTTGVYIKAGGSFVEYSAAVPVDASTPGYRVSYELYNYYREYLDEGYYSSSGTTTSSSGILVDVKNGNIANIDMTLLTRTTPTAISLNQSTATIMVGQTKQLSAAITPENIVDKSVSWTVSSQNPENVAIVSQTGVVTALNVGTAVIRAISNADPTKHDDCIVTVTTGPAIGFSALPVVKIGVNPDADNIAGMFIGLENTINTTGGAIQTTSIAGYNIEVTFDPNQVSISEVLNATTSGAVFSSKIEIANGIGKVKVAGASSSGIDNCGKLFFIPITLKGSAYDVTEISVNYVDVRDISLHTVNVPALENFEFRRGKIDNGETGDPNLADAVAGLQYLARLKNPGPASEDVNLVNMASINESGINPNSAKANIKDIIALMQYSVDLRDEYFNLKLPPIVTGATLSNDGYMVSVIFDKPMVVSTTSAGFSITVNGVAAEIMAIALNADPHKLDFTLQRPVPAGSEVRVSYDGTGGVHSLDNQFLGSFSNQIVTWNTVNLAPTFAYAMITGTPEVGEELTASGIGYADAESDDPGTPIYQWMVSATIGGMYADIADATEATYTPTVEDIDHFIKVRVTPVAISGTLIGTAVTSTSPAAITAADSSGIPPSSGGGGTGGGSAPAPLPTAPPIITGILTAVDTSVSGTATTGSSITLSINGVAEPTVIATNGHWTVSDLTLAVGDMVTVTAVLPGKMVSYPTYAHVEAILGMIPKLESHILLSKI